MDGTRFDAITRDMAVGAPRRVVLKGAAGGLLAAAATLFGARRSMAQPTCRQEGSPCEGNQVCCPGLICMEAGPSNTPRCVQPPPCERGPTEVVCLCDAEVCSPGTVCAGPEGERTCRGAEGEPGPSCPDACTAVLAAELTEVRARLALLEHHLVGIAPGRGRRGAPPPTTRSRGRARRPRGL